MSLVSFHKFLIATAILFSAGFAVRQLAEYRASRDVWALLTAIVLAGAAAAFAYYLGHLRGFLRLPSQSGGLKSPPRSLADARLWPPGSQTAAAEADSAPAHSGNGHELSNEWAGLRPKPAIPPEKDNGHGE